ncbi:hypothetical protein PL373_08100 [Tenacibaculum maritimum]|nr:hypothetical protein [Tenacibaculum maritimum]MDB0601107.1 hypothetical protein [Tenacibaculum maritimum]MDB0612189.1 hypothetical protein [Tenacibaculum maritimum]
MKLEKPLKKQQLQQRIQQLDKILINTLDTALYATLLKDKRTLENELKHL